MKLEEQVVSLEIAKKLKSLNVKQESYFYWSKAMDKVFWKIENSQFFAVDNRRDVSAFTVAELGEMLPGDIVSGHTPNCPTRKEYEVLDYIEFAAAAYHHDDSKVIKPRFIDRNEADARGKMLIYLLENKLI